jgi:hypothetical protein
MKNSNDLGIYEGMGMHIINPDTHYICSEAARQSIRGLIRQEYGVDPTDAVVDAFIDNEEDWHIVEHLPVEHELRERYGITFIDEDRCETPEDRLMKLLDEACMRQEGLTALGPRVYDPFN